MIQMEVNGKTISAKEDETILVALARAGIKIPTLCYMEDLEPTGACRLCVVEVEGFPNLVPSCSHPVQEGMKIHTRSPEVLRARRVIVELLLSNHPDDCLYCVRNGSCDLQRLAQEMGIRKRTYRGSRSHHPLDVSTQSIVRDPDKCILCGKCVRVCEEIQGVSAIDFIQRGAGTYVGTAFDKGLNMSSCVNCGQCILVCPTGALTERSYVDEVLNAIADPSKIVVVQHAPAVSVTLAEEFGIKPGTDVDAQMVAALRMAGFDRVFDTSFSADLTIMEEGSELVHRIQTGGALPMLTSCSPGWIKYIEQFFPELLPNVSTCKSPQQMLGALIKRFWAPREKLESEEVVSVSIMPCTAKKFEAARPEMARDYVRDVDYVLTTREIARLLKRCGVDLAAMKSEAADTPFGERSSAGKIFGTSGGVMEAAVRTANFLITGEELQDLKLSPLRGLDGCKELHVDVGDLKVGAAVVNGLLNARKILEEVKAGRKDLHFIEVMCCPGGCIGGGGQPLLTDSNRLKERMKMLYQIDRDETLRTSHANKWIQRIYDEFLGEPLGELSHELLHTHYHKRSDILL